MPDFHILKNQQLILTILVPEYMLYSVHVSVLVLSIVTWWCRSNLQKIMAGIEQAKQQVSEVFAYSCGLEYMYYNMYIMYTHAARGDCCSNEKFHRHSSGGLCRAVHLCLCWRGVFSPPSLPLSLSLLSSLSFLLRHKRTDYFGDGCEWATSNL